MLQRYRQRRKPHESRLVISIVDLGVGIRFSLERQGLVNSGMSDSQCIIKALEKGITGTGKKRGIGLHEVKHRALKGAGNSELRIRSGCGAITLNAKGLQSEDELPSIPGVQICLSIEGGQFLHGWI